GTLLRLFLVPAAGAVRQDRHPHDGDGYRPLWEFSHPGLRARLRARLGAPRQSLLAGRHVERRADSSRRLRQVREHACSRMGSRQASDLRRLLLDYCEGRFPVPKEAYYMSGAGGQWTLIIPSHDLVVVRLGHYRGAAPGERSFSAALALLMQAVPRRV